MDFFKSKFFKIFKYLIIILIIIISGLGILIHYKVDNFCNDRLSKFVEEKTAGRYTISLSNISYNPFFSNLHVKDLKIGTAPEKATDFNLTLSVESLHIKHIRLFDLFYKKELAIEQLEITDPLFEISHQTEDNHKKEDIKQLIETIQPVLNSYFSSVSIKQVSFINAGLLNKKKSASLLATKKAIAFNIGITNFYADSLTLSTDEYFKAEDVFLGIDNYEKLLSDSIHVLQAQKLTYSVRNKGINATNVSLAPSDSTQNQQTLYWVNLPKLTIHSKNIDEIFMEDTIRIDTLEMNNARIRVVPPPSEPGINFRELKEFDLFQMVKDEFNQLNIKALKLSANRLLIERSKAGHKNNQLFENLSVNLDGFQLDSGSFVNPDKILYSDNLFIQVNKYYIDLNDQVHKFSAQNIRANSKTSKISADYLKMWATDVNVFDTQVNLNCDSIQMLDIDMKSLYHSREMPVSSMAAYRPVINILKSTKKVKTEIESTSLLYNFINNYIKGIYSNLITIENGKLSIQSGNKTEATTIKTNFAFKLTDFSLDSISARKTDKLFFATNIELSFSNYHMKMKDQLHVLDMDLIEVSSLQRKASIKNLRLHPLVNQGLNILKKQKQAGLYNIVIPNLYLGNTNIHHAFFNKNLNINYFAVNNPRIQFELNAKDETNTDKFGLDDFYLLIKDYINDVKIGKLTIPNGDFKLINHDRKGKTISFDNRFNLTLEGFRFNEEELTKDRLLFSDEVELTLKDHLFKLSDNVHFLQLKEIGISTKNNEILVKNALLYPDITSPQYQNLPRHLQIDIPTLTITGVDIQKAFKSSRVSLEKLSINDPNIKIYQAENSGSRLYLKDFTLPLPIGIKLVELNKLDINDGRISLLKLHNNEADKILSSGINLTSSHVKFESKENNQPAKLSASSVESRVKDLILTPLTGNYNFSVSELNYSQANKQASLNNLKISLKDEARKDQLRGISIKKLDILGLKTYKAKLKDMIHVSTITTDGAIFNYTLSNQPEDKIDLYNLKLNDDLLTLMDDFSCEQINLNNAVVNIQQKNESRQFKNINISLNNFHLNNRPSKQFLGSEKFRLSLKNLTNNRISKWYNFSCDEFNYSSSTCEASFHHFKVDPKFSKEEFQKRVPFQTDYFQGKIDELKMTGFDLMNYLDKNEFHGSMIGIDGIQLDIFRDMRKPFNQKQLPPMPQQLLLGYEPQFYFDSVKIENSNITYSEQFDLMPDPGTISFQQINTTVYPFTNIRKKLIQNPIINLKTSSDIYNTAHLNAHIQFNMLSADNEFFIRGDISPFDMTILNPVTSNTALISIKSGQLNRFEFDFHANDLVARGKLKFAYDDLKVNILSIKDGNTKESKFASFMANSLMLKSKNPRTRFLIPDAIYFERDPHRSILNYWWKSVFSGAKNTFGIKED